LYWSLFWDWVLHKIFRNFSTTPPYLSKRATNTLNCRFLILTIYHSRKKIHFFHFRSRSLIPDTTDVLYLYININRAKSLLKEKCKCFTFKCYSKLGWGILYLIFLHVPNDDSNKKERLNKVTRNLASKETKATRSSRTTHTNK